MPEGEVNNVSLTEKHETDNVDELNKAMKLFNLEEKNDGRKEKDVKRGTN